MSDDNKEVGALRWCSCKARMMNVLQRSNGKWVIIHAAREVAKDFDTEAEAWAWADHNIDDQVFCEPNWFSAPLEYRRT